jgi:D-beta-D-heptose 7-phosphate kinase/D-beta-D-heptose 1-phosphate adenosyltransferase
MGRVVGDAELESELAEAAERGERVVLTNGSFDLLHPGHLGFLRDAKNLGDLLVVGVNSDDAALRLKGPGRPLVAENDRAELVAALEPVDLVVIYPELRADQLIRRLRPAVYVKGGAFGPDTLPEAPTAAELGVEVRVIPYHHGYSTAGQLQRARQAGEG